MGILIQGGRIVDAATDTDKKGDIYLEDGVISRCHYAGGEGTGTF